VKQNCTVGIQSRRAFEVKEIGRQLEDEYSKQAFEAAMIKWREGSIGVIGRQRLLKS